MPGIWTARHSWTHSHTHLIVSQVHLDPSSPGALQLGVRISLGIGVDGTVIEESKRRSLLLLSLKMILSLPSLMLVESQA